MGQTSSSSSSAAVEQNSTAPPTPLSVEERDFYLRAFSKIDIDGDERIAYHELKRYYKKSFGDDLTPTEMQMMMHEAGDSRDRGYIDIEDFAKICRSAEANNASLKVKTKRTFCTT